MPDRLPRLYRSLEKRSGQNELDAVVTAAVGTYTAIRQPSAHHGRDLARLVIPAWPRLTDATKTEIALTLALSPELPDTLKEVVASAPVVIVHAEAPSADPIKDTAARNDDSFDVLPPVSQGSQPAETGDAAESVRQTLREMARPGGRAKEPVDGTSHAPAPTTLSALIDILRRDETAEGFGLLASLLRLDAARAREMIDDASGLSLATTLKAVDARIADLTALVVLLKPEIAADSNAIAKLRSTYRELDIDSCRTAIGLAEVLPPVLQARSSRDHSRRSMGERDETERAGPPRPAFGRRRSIPVSRRKTRS